jgi:hypothetical protein|tara:strand:- start:3073 stop:3231 length:159 start_codon:yes stop_codon:yes gene_type:complete
MDKECKRFFFSGRTAEATSITQAPVASTFIAQEETSFAQKKASTAKRTAQRG